LNATTSGKGLIYSTESWEKCWYLQENVDVTDSRGRSLAPSFAAPIEQSRSSNWPAPTSPDGPLKNMMFRLKCGISSCPNRLPEGKLSHSKLIKSRLRLASPHFVRFSPYFIYIW
jgi:hypothetical protein